ncbi:hypothetical protein [Roseateles violae]|uniref:3-oxoacyl-[acyl-carrier-protein] synthase-1 n=1 Tax=Roseateles violae TaxID=3058042 RepID=A0ABT8DNT1_9BURK|nr:hypothetical protein [Pelomonas sp. PFR6]MDN3920020.1 hypothetical protein [Pelomonas sp. PFR6]
MHRAPLAIEGSGMVTSVGMSAAATCAAIRAGVQGVTETQFTDGNGELIRAAQVQLARPWRGVPKLLAMMASAAHECLVGAPMTRGVPIVCCVADPDQGGPFADLAEQAVSGLSERLGIRFDENHSAVIAGGRTGLGLALVHAHHMLYDGGVDRVLIVAGDSLVTRDTLSSLEDADRLLAGDNLNGFIPGEAAAAVMLSRPGAGTVLVCSAIAQASESATIVSDEPLRADGLVAAIRSALTDATIEPGAIDLRLTDLSGEHYYFREAALALSRIVKATNKELPLWHPADCVGQVGAAIGPIVLGVALAAVRKRYAPGPNVLVHLSEDAGSRVALVLQSTAPRHG